mgnify:CR=1 FL=1
MECLVNNMIPEFIKKAKEKLNDMNKWYYKDPQGQVQGQCVVLYLMRENYMCKKKS